MTYSDPRWWRDLTTRMMVGLKFAVVPGHALVLPHLNDTIKFLYILFLTGVGSAQIGDIPELLQEPPTASPLHRAPIAGPVAYRRIGVAWRQWMSPPG